MYDDWCVEEERKYIFGSTCDVFMPPALVKLHEELVKEIESDMAISDDCKKQVVAIIDKKFGPKLSTGE